MHHADCLDHIIVSASGLDICFSTDKTMLDVGSDSELDDCYGASERATRALTAFHPAAIDHIFVSARYSDCTGADADVCFCADSKTKKTLDRQWRSKRRWAEFLAGKNRHAKLDVDRLKKKFAMKTRFGLTGSSDTYLGLLGATVLKRFVMLAPQHASSSSSSSTAGALMMSLKTSEDSKDSDECEENGSIRSNSDRYSSDHQSKSISPPVEPQRSPPRRRRRRPRARACRSSRVSMPCSRAARPRRSRCSRAGTAGRRTRASN